MTQKDNGMPEHVEILRNGLFFVKKSPVFGMQDMGISPGGPMDRFAAETGNILLSNPPGSLCLEIIIPPVIRFTGDVYFVFTGAQYSGTVIESGETRIPVEHGKVYPGRSGDILRTGVRIKGFRTYLSLKQGSGCFPDSSMTERRREGSEIFSWLDPEGFIRVLPGPEYSYLTEPEDFFKSMWRISEDSDSMGIRLSRTGGTLHSDIMEIISDPVADGTVQLTPSGPVILMRDRQTIGGYPRIFSVISPDIDLLAQYMPGEYLKFREVTLADAWGASRRRVEIIESMKTIFRVELQG